MKAYIKRIHMGEIVGISIIDIKDEEALDRHMESINNQDFWKDDWAFETTTAAEYKSFC